MTRCLAAVKMTPLPSGAPLPRLEEAERFGTGDGSMTGARSRTIFTIGHSNHSLGDFVSLLRRHGVTAVADVRSSPHSRHCPHFNREVLSRVLPGEGIEYAYLGRELGARPTDPDCYRNGRADFRLLRLTRAFRTGLEQLSALAARGTTAVMCAEKDPLDCHRMILVSRAFRACDLAIWHIREDGGLENNEDVERRLVALMHVERTLFDAEATDADLIERAYDLRSSEIAHGIEVGEDAAVGGSRA